MSQGRKRPVAQKKFDRLHRIIHKHFRILNENNYKDNGGRVHLSQNIQPIVALNPFTGEGFPLYEQSIGAIPATGPGLMTIGATLGQVWELDYLAVLHNDTLARNVTMILNDSTNFASSGVHIFDSAGLECAKNVWQTIFPNHHDIGGGDHSHPVSPWPLQISNRGRDQGFKTFELFVQTLALGAGKTQALAYSYRRLI